MQDIERCHPGLSRTTMRKELGVASFFFLRSFIMGITEVSEHQRSRMMVALRAMEDDGLEAILDPERTSRTATDLWNGLNAHQFIGQVNKNIFWSWPCRHLDCRALAPGDLWLQTKENPEDHGHFGCHKCVRAYAPFRTSVALAPAQRVMMVKMKPDSQDMAAMDCASFVHDCESGTQFRHYLTEWPSDALELAQ